MGRVRLGWRQRLLVGIVVGACVLVGLWLLFVRSIRRYLVQRFETTYAAPSGPLGDANTVKLVVVARGFAKPTDLQFVPGVDRRLVVLEKGGRARVVRLPAPGETPANAEHAGELFTVKVLTPSELGLLGLAFHPRFSENGRFFAHYNPDDGGAMRTKITEWHVPPGRIGKEPAREGRVVLEVPQPYQNHDGGQIAFGPDGMLYVALGDGGWMDDPEGNGQNRATLLGAILRLDVEATGGAYAVPDDNPFVGVAGARPEIWAFGLRNPWKFDFADRGRLIVADVGQNDWEEIDVVERGANLGWRIREGRHCFPPKSECARTGLVDPVFEYGRELGQSVTGGFVYRGRALPIAADRYVFGDFATGRIWALPATATLEPGRPAEAQLLGRVPWLISTFGRDAEGEIYVADFASGDVALLAAAR